MLIVLKERKQVGSTDHREREIAVQRETVHRMVPVDDRAVRVTFEDGEEMTLVGTIRELAEQLNG